MIDVAVSVRNATKIYALYDDPLDRLKESLHPLRKKYRREFYALQNIQYLGSNTQAVKSRIVLSKIVFIHIFHFPDYYTSYFPLKPIIFTCSGGFS